MATNWKDIKTGVGRAANKTVKKAGELADTASLHFKLKSLNARLADKFERLGRLTYKQLKTEISHAEEIASVIDDIDSLREEIKLLKAKIESLKKERKSSAEDIKIEDEAPAKEEASEEN